MLKVGYFLYFNIVRKKVKKIIPKLQIYKTQVNVVIKL